MLVSTLELAMSGPDETRAFAAAIAPLLRVGDVVALSGDLGAGKTCFVQGAVSGLGVEARVTSPTFVLVRQYEGRLPIVHCDVYRLDRLQDVHDLGDDVLAPDVVTFLEWADAVRPLLPDDRLEIELSIPDPAAATTRGDIEVADDEDRRTATVRGFGPRWTERADALTDAVRPWLSGHRVGGGPAVAPGTAPGTPAGPAARPAPTVAPESEQPEQEDR